MRSVGPQTRAGSRDELSPLSEGPVCQCWPAGLTKTARPAPAPDGRAFLSQQSNTGSGTDGLSADYRWVHTHTHTHTHTLKLTLDAPSSSEVSTRHTQPPEITKDQHTWSILRFQHMSFTCKLHWRSVTSKTLF